MNKELVENILCEFIYLDCNREINYKNMTGGRVVMRTLECAVDSYKRMADEVEEEDEDYE